MKTLAQLAALLLAVVLPSCAGTGQGGTTTIPVSTQAAQTVGSDQGTAQATESGSATNTVNPTIFNINGARTVKIRTTREGENNVEVEGQENGDVEISGANMGIRFGDEGQSASISSGGGSAGGVGGAVRQGTTTGTTGSTNAAGVTPAAPARPVALPTTPGGQ